MTEYLEVGLRRGIGSDARLSLSLYFSLSLYIYLSISLSLSFVVQMSVCRLGFCLSDKKRRRMNLDAFAELCA